MLKLTLNLTSTQLSDFSQAIALMSTPDSPRFNYEVNQFVPDLTTVHIQTDSLMLIYQLGRTAESVQNLRIVQESISRLKPEKSLSFRWLNALLLTVTALNAFCIQVRQLHVPKRAKIGV